MSLLWRLCCECAWKHSWFLGHHRWARTRFDSDCTETTSEYSQAAIVMATWAKQRWTACEYWSLEQRLRPKTEKTMFQCVLHLLPWKWIYKWIGSWIWNVFSWITLCLWQFVITHRCVWVCVCVPVEPKLHVVYRFYSFSDEKNNIMNECFVVDVVFLFLFSLFAFSFEPDIN